MIREELIEALTDTIIDGMDLDTLITFAKEQLSRYYDKLDYNDLVTEAEIFASHLLDGDEVEIPETLKKV